MSEQTDLGALKSELQDLRQSIRRIKQEISVVHCPDDEIDHFQTISDQLSATTKATERAAHTILDATERSDVNIADLRSIVRGNAGAEEILSQMTKNTQKIYEACAFQDITAQRISNVTASLRDIKERIHFIARLLDDDALDDIKTDAPNKTNDEKLLNGPQPEGKGLMQSDIDALLD